MDYGKFVGDGGYPDLLNAAAERERALQAEVATLRAQVGSLSRAIRLDMAARLGIRYYIRDDMRDQSEHERLEIQSWLDGRDLHLIDVGLTPEPHGAANDTPGSQPEPCDTKARKSITSADGETEADHVE